jgi:transcriptional regulator with XRE-family HTH domain
MQPLDSMASLKPFSREVAASDQTLASAIRRLRVERGVTQEALAFNAQVTIATLSRIERGVTNPAWPTLKKIANALHITPGELVAATEDTPERSSERS